MNARLIKNILSSGSFQKADELGERSAGYNSAYGGGNVKIEAAALELVGKIHAKGYQSGSGGGVQIIINGGAISGNGVIDVGVEPGGSHSYYRAGGGRISITGHNSISQEIIANAKMDRPRRHRKIYNRSCSLSI